MSIDILRTIDRHTVWRLQALGATVTDTHITATFDVLWNCGIIGKVFDLLIARGQLTISGGAVVVVTSNLTLGASPLKLGTDQLVLGV